MGIDRGWEMFPKTELCEWLSKINSPDLSNNAYDNTPHTVLASYYQL